LPEPTTRYHASLITGLELTHQGKVRDTFAIDDELMLIVASDRLSAFDVVLPDSIPGKGEILTRISNFWFERTAAIVPNHLSGMDVARFVRDPAQLALLRDRAVVVKRLKPLPLEAIVRAYIAGSGWKEYQQTGTVSGEKLPSGLRLADRLPALLFTPSSKAPAGQHDENIRFADLVAAIGRTMAEAVRGASIALFRHAVDHAGRRGIIIADTKFEFGLDAAGQLRLMDEMLTPDSSRFWPVESWAPGSSPPSFDKQYVRDYLETLDWNKQAPGPALPPEIIAATAAKYREACARLMGPATEDD
jgi:phosphoribosylaminoimidazole-succinocarboxamide synthase